MKWEFIIILSLVSLNVLAACDKGKGLSIQNKNKSDSLSNRMKIKIGTNTFTATLLENETVTVFKAMLPLTLNMSELNGNEKHADLPSDLPVNASKPGTIQAGDLMLWGSNTLVLFYKSFSTSYSYTKLGHIDDPAGLASAVGSNSITVTFELE